MKQLNKFWAALLATLVWTSCTNEQATELEQQIDGKRAIQVTLPDYESGDAETRTNFKPDNLAFSWADKDTLGIFPEQGDQVNFALSGGSGDKCATFTGGGWALKSGNKYYAYYPFSRQCYAGEHMKNEIPVSLIGQTQKGDKSTAHLGKYAYMYAEGSNSSNGKVSLTMKPLTVILKLILTLPVTDQVESVTLSTSKAEFCTQGSFDLQSPASGITPSNELEKELSLACKNLQATAEQPFTTYLILTSASLKQKDVTVTVNTQSNGTYSETFRPSQNWSAGKYYTKEISWVVHPLIVGETSIDRSNGKVTAKASIESGENISGQGFYYSSTNPYPGKNDGIINGRLASGNVIEADVSSLAPYIRYYIRAFATNDNETAVGEVTEFAVKATTPRVTISAMGNASNYTLKGNVETDGGSPVTEYGFYIGDGTCEDIAALTSRGNKISNPSDFSFENYSPQETSKKFVCAYATNAEGTAYSEVQALEEPFVMLMINVHKESDTETLGPGGFIHTVTYRAWFNSDYKFDSEITECGFYAYQGEQYYTEEELKSHGTRYQSDLKDFRFTTTVTVPFNDPGGPGEWITKNIELRVMVYLRTAKGTEHCSTIHSDYWEYWYDNSPGPEVWE